MELVRNGRNGTDSGSLFAVLTPDIGKLDRKIDDGVGKLDGRISRLEDRVGKLEDRVGKLDDRVGKLDDRASVLAERVARVETGIDFLRSDIKNLSDGLLAVRTTDFRLMFGALIAVALTLSAMMAKGFGWL